MLVVEPDGPLSEGMVLPVPVDDPRVGQVLEMLCQVWPEAAVEAEQTIAGWYPVRAVYDFSRGHFSGCAPRDGWIYSSVNDILGGCEGIVHEMGHLKLKRMGVFYEEWTAVLANRPDELYPSPIRKDKLRPMGAVLHGLYSYLYVTEFDRRAVALGLDGPETLATNRARIAEGIATLEAHCRPTPDGQDFIDHVLRWGHALEV